MKYRIKKVEKHNGETKFYPEYKEFWTWHGIDTTPLSLNFRYHTATEEEAMKFITSHKEKQLRLQGDTVKSVTYIDNL